ncbi:hypothetical protein RSC2_01514 [Bacillus paralicheniformis]|nr:hypothetical protein RSC1_04057 [Bacillus paralicheniformis]BCE09718.1 hypothetical protein RSC2_01514 [Bacillus paralicheniformis]BCE15891.1 hypothetical protein RSC3_03247 [Bacillus paralicheniformis]
MLSKPYKSRVRSYLLSIDSFVESCILLYLFEGGFGKGFLLKVDRRIPPVLSY